MIWHSSLEWSVKKRHGCLNQKEVGELYWWLSKALRAVTVLSRDYKEIIAIISAIFLALLTKTVVPLFRNCHTAIFKRTPPLPSSWKTKLTCVKFRWCPPPSPKNWNVSLDTKWLETIGPLETILPKCCYCWGSHYLSSRCRSVTIAKFVTNKKMRNLEQKKKPWK